MRTFVPSYSEVIELVDATIHPDAIISPSELTIVDWVTELNVELNETQLASGSMPLERFWAATHLTRILVPYAIATNPGFDSGEFVDTSTTLVELLMDFLGLGDDHTLQQLRDALEAEAELEEEDHS